MDKIAFLSVTNFKFGKMRVLLYNYNDYIFSMLFRNIIKTKIKCFNDFVLY